jgi:ATP-binding cassette subfamily F protein uup
MAAPLLQLRAVRLADGPRLMFEGVDLTLERGARACLVGRNGAGKSTLLRLVSGAIEPDDGERTVTPGLRVALVSQEPNVEAASLEVFATAGGAERHRARAALEAFGLDPEREGRGLSGGEARRAALARAFAESPDLLLMDEPTNHLDILAIAALETRLGRQRAAVLVVSHDRAFLERTTDCCFWLEGRRLRRLDAGYRQFEDWAADITAAEARASSRLAGAIEREERWLARGVTGRRARNEGRLRRLAALRAEKSRRMREAAGALTMASGPAPRSGALVLEARSISKRYGERQVIQGFSTRILRGDRVAVIGPNGAGKSTLAGLLLGITPPDQGSVRIGTGLEVVSVSQARSELTPGKSVAEILAPGGGDQIMVRGKPRHVAGYAADFQIRAEQLRQPVESLSGGERNRLLLAGALAKPANLLVLDEPTNDLDLETLDLLEDVLADFGGAMILVSHDRDFIERLATSTIALDGRGGIVETPGGWDDFVAQNPGFFERPLAPPRIARPKPVRDRTGAVKMSYRDARRMAELEADMPALAAKIAAEERRLTDPELYGRDPEAFLAIGERLEALRRTLSEAEAAWLDLAAQAEALGANRAPA